MDIFFPTYKKCIFQIIIHEGGEGMEKVVMVAAYDPTGLRPPPLLPPYPDKERRGRRINPEEHRTCGEGV